jgi:SAM-dependent methyltransferase
MPACGMWRPTSCTATLTTPPGSVLDVGCGTGATLRWLAELYPQARCLGLDLALDAVALCRRDGLAGTCVASALALPLPPASVDLVVSHDVLQHLPLPHGDREALAETRRVLRPGGCLLLRTNASAGRTMSDEAAQFRRYHPRDLARRVEGAGFRILALSRINLVGSAVERLRGGRRPPAEAGRYTGLPLGPEVPRSRWDPLKRGLLSLEGRWIARGGSLPLGHGAVCLARRR